MAHKRKRSKLKKPRNMVALGLILARKGGTMKDRREGRKGEAEREELESELDRANECKEAFDV